MEISKIRGHDPRLEPFIIPLLPRETDGKRILELGPGPGFWAYQIRALSDGTPHITGMDIDPRFHNLNARIGLYDAFILGDLGDYDPPTGPYYDFVFWFEGPEHLEKNKALFLLRDLQKCAREILISCPYQFLEIQDKEYPPMSHKSAWWPDDFEKLGYKAQIIDLRAYYFTRPIKVIDDLRRLVFRLGNHDRFILAHYQNRALRGVRK